MHPVETFLPITYSQGHPFFIPVLFFQKAVAKISAEKFIPNKNLSQCADVEM